jgi:CheY-like chemotaxis protein
MRATDPDDRRRMNAYHILIGNSEESLSDFFEALFREVCDGKAALRCTRTRQVSEFVRQGCDVEFDLVIQVPHNLLPAVNAPTPIGFIGEGIRAIRAIKSKHLVPVIAIVAPEERARYEPLLLEAGADCVLELPFEGEELSSAVARLLKLPARPEYLRSTRWFFAGVLRRGLQRLTQA